MQHPQGRAAKRRPIRFQYVLCCREMVFVSHSQHCYRLRSNQCVHTERQVQQQEEESQDLGSRAGVIWLRSALVLSRWLCFGYGQFRFNACIAQRETPAETQAASSAVNEDRKLYLQVCACLCIHVGFAAHRLAGRGCAHHEGPEDTAVLAAGRGLYA